MMFYRCIANFEREDKKSRREKREDIFIKCILCVSKSGPSKCSIGGWGGGGTRRDDDGGLVAVRQEQPALRRRVVEVEHGLRRRGVARTFLS